VSSIGDVFLRILLDDTDFEKRVIETGKKAGDKAGLSMGQQIAAGISSSATKIGGALAGIGQNLSKTGRSMTTNLTLPLLAAGGAATKLALDFDTTLRQIVGLTDVTGEEIDDVREKILALGPAVGKGPQELAEAFYFIASAGFKADEAMEVLETSAKAAASGLGETQTIAQVLGGVINAYGRENITAAKAADILTEAVSQGTAEASGLASVIGNVVPGAAALGVSFDQVTAAMAGMTLSGVGVEESATSLIQIFSSLQKPTSQAEEALRGMGLSSAELRRQLREEGLLATLRTLEERFAGNETASAAVFGNIRALRGVTALLTLDSTQLNAVFEKVADSTGRMGEAYEETEGPQRELDRNMADLQATAIQLGTDVLPMVVDVLGQIAGAARALGKWWKSLDDDTRKGIVQWLAWVAIAGPVLILFGKLASGAAALFKVVGFLFGARGIPALITVLKSLRLASFAALGPIGLLVAAVVILYELLDGTAEAKQFDTFAKKLGKSAGHLKSDLDKAGVSAEEFAAAVETAGGNVELAFDRLVNGAGRAVVDTAAALREGGGAVKDAAAELPTEVAAALIDGQFEIGPAAEVMVDPIDEAMQKAKQDVADAAVELIHALATGLSSNPQELRDAAQAMIEDILHPFPDAKHRLEIEGILARGDWITGLTSPDSGDRARTAEYLKGILTEYEQLAPGALAAGKLLNPALQDGIDQTLAALKTYLETVTGDIVSEYELADELQRMGYDGLAGWVRGHAAQQQTAATTAAQTRLRIAKEMHLDLVSAGRTASQTFLNGFTSTAYSAATGWLTGLKNMLVGKSPPPEGPLKDLDTGAALASGAWVSAFLERLREAIPGVSGVIGQIASSMALQPSGLAAASVPSMGAVASQTGSIGDLPPTGANVTNYNLNVTGSLPMNDAEDAIWELRRLAGIKK
jgi:TP901 family phage tail tape measure protein